MYSPLISSGEYWRLFTAMFLHVGIVHLLLNSLGLFIFGPQVESLYGRYRFIIIYVLAGLCGSVASFLLNRIVVGAGASGAIFGILAALTAFLVARRRETGEYGRQTLMGLLVLAGINLMLGFTLPGIDNFAHMGGFAGGFVLGYVMAPKLTYTEYIDPFGGYHREARDTNPLRKSWWIVPVMSLVIVAGVLFGSATTPDNTVSRTEAAERLYEEGRYPEALEEASRAVSLDPTYAPAREIRARILASMGREGSR
jgi:rhomboid protease GluP